MSHTFATARTMSQDAPRAPVWLHSVCLGALAAALFVGTGGVHTAHAQAIATPAPNVVQALPAFQRLRLASSIDVDLTQAAAGAAASIVISGPADSVARTRLRVDGGVLHIESQPCIGICVNWLKGVRAQVSAATVEALDVVGSGDLSVSTLKQPKLHVAISGSGDVAIKSLEVDELNLALAGSGDLKAAGTATRQHIAIAGSGDVYARDLRGQDVVVKIAGSGDAHVWAERSIAASVAGSGDVMYRGSPTQKSISTAGSGDVINIK